MADAETDNNPGPGDEIVREARERFNRALDWEAIAWQRWEEDVKFANADSDNMYQWPSALLTGRGYGTETERPCLTVNKTQQHCFQIINDARQNKTSIKIKAAGGGASYEAAQILEGMVRHIEYISDAQSAYTTATRHQVEGGIGYFRIATDYAAPDTLEQEIFIRRVKDPSTIRVDPDFQEADGSDMRFAFAFHDMPKDEFKKRYPRFKDISDYPLGADISQGGWIKEKHVRVAEYFRRVRSQKDRLVVMTDPATGQKVQVRASKVPPELKEVFAEVVDDPDTQTREIEDTKVEWYLIAGDKVLEKRIWAGKYIPIVRVPGVETIIDGELDRKGHVRALKDAQRMLNYNAPLALDTPLPTPSGWTTMGEVEPGDWLLSERGLPVQVLGLSPIFFRRDCYRVEFDDGSTIVADAQHKWRVEARGKRVAAGTVWEDRTVETVDLFPGKHFIYVTDPLDGPEVDLPIDPYVLGAWLGDGDSSGGGFTASAADYPVMKANLGRSGYHVGEPHQDKSTACHFSVFGLRGRLSKAKLLGNKHIPAIYLRASYAQRLALLQGLMDTDGCVSKAGQCVFTNGNRAIQEGFAELLRTLGLKATYADIEGRLSKFPSGRSYQTQAVRRFAFTAYADTPAFRMERKLERQLQARGQERRRTKRHRIISVTEVPSVPVRCVGVDSESHLFLAGEGMVPTHNSGQVETVALQMKVPWAGPAAAIEGYETYWDSANVQNYSYLPYNHIDETGKEIPAPVRASPPQSSPAFQEGMQTAENHMMLVSGQYQADVGAPSNERSGVAIQQRQRQGENATYHFIDHLAMATRFAGKIIIDLIPKIYDTKRVIKIMAEDGTDSDVTLDPQAQQAYVKQAKQTEEAAEQVIFNPGVGRYEVMSDVGPAFATRRQEAFNALSQIASQNHELMGIIGDLVLKAADFPMADEAAERLKRMVPPQALGDGPNPQLMQLQQQLQASQQIIQHLAQQLKDKGEDQQLGWAQKTIDVHKAETARIAALKDAFGTDPDGIQALVRQMVAEAMNTPMNIAPLANPHPVLNPPPEAPQGAQDGAQQQAA